jgi:hypothetical protein
VEKVKNAWKILVRQPEGEVPLSSPAWSCGNHLNVSHNETVGRCGIGCVWLRCGSGGEGSVRRREQDHFLTD